MKWTNYLILGVSVWILQILTSGFFSIQTIRPDFLVILVLYWSIRDGRFIGVIVGFLLGLLIDLSGTALFFGLSPLIYSITGYLAGSLSGSYSKISPVYFSLFWIAIIAFQFLIFCGVYYQELWFIDRQIFLGKWFGTTIYTLSFTGILQFIYPLHRLS